MSDPMDEAPDGVISIDPDLGRAAQELADSLCYFPEENDHRSLTLFGTNYNFSTMRAASEALVEARFRLTRALVAFAYAERAKASTRKLAAALTGDA